MNVDPAELSSLEQMFERAGATARASVKLKPRGPWITKVAGLRLRIALEHAAELLADANTHEAAVFVEHPRVDGIFVWKSIYPSLLARGDELFWWLDSES